MSLPASRSKRVLRFLLISFVGALGFMVLVLVSSRMATESVFRGIESSRATGLSSYLPKYMQTSLVQSAGNDLQIVRSGSLTLGTRDFDAVRERLRSVVQEHQGHFDELEISSSQDSGRTLTATIRLPAEDFDSTLTQLRALGVAQQESQAEAQVSTAESDQVTAKLASARFTEDRLDRLTRERSGKLGEYLEVEQEIAKIRGEIEDLEAQQRRRAERVQYAVIQVNLKEEYAERFNLKRAVILAQLHSAVVGGLQGVVEQGASVLSVLLRVGPTLLLWFSLLFWPVRLGWRKARRLFSAHPATT